MGSYTDLFRTASNVESLRPNRKPLAPQVDPYRKIADDMAAASQRQQAIENPPPPPPAAPQQTKGDINIPNTYKDPSVGPVSNFAQAPAQDPLAVAIGSQTQPGAMRPIDPNDPSTWPEREAPPSGGPEWRSPLDTGDWGKGPGGGLNVESGNPNDPNRVNPPGDGKESYEEMLRRLLGESGDFSPTEELMNEQRDASLRQLAESGASRGMGNSGFEDAMAGDIYRGTARDVGQAYQDFEGKEKDRYMQGLQMLQSAEFKKMDQQQQKDMANLMYEIGRWERYGKDGYPGDAAFDAGMSFINNPDSGPDGKKLGTQMLFEMMGYEKFYNLFHNGLNANELRDIFANDPEALAWLEGKIKTPLNNDPQPKPDEPPPDNNPPDEPPPDKVKPGRAAYDNAVDAWAKAGGTRSGRPKPKLSDYV
jgi:hypothetical protein